ncbi:MAG TPA: DUF1501 domain-containing protein [Nitrospira sp.]|nr:DUF1501 domain-containing protein [Nitrospira sp.]
MSCSRRTFLTFGALTLLALSRVPPFLTRTAFAQENTARRKTLIVIFQRGAVDGLSLLVPHGERAYYEQRKTIAIRPPQSGNADTAVDLDGFFGFHPALAPLKPLWDARRLAVVHACGSPHPTRSHFDAQDYMESGTPGEKNTADGWLARALEVSPPVQVNPLRAVAFTTTVPRSLQGRMDAVTVSNLADFDVKGGSPLPGSGIEAQPGFEHLYEQGIHDLLYDAGREAFDAMKLLKARNLQASPPANGAEYPRGRFGDTLRQIAQLIKADVGVEIAFTECGGWDTHVRQGNERGQLAARLTEFALALGALDRDLGDRIGDVAVLTMSEFGRRVQENGNGGTDHGHGTAMMVLGGTVRGGRVVGRWPGLAKEQLFDGRDLQVTTDFRQLFTEVAVRHLKLAPGIQLFPKLSVKADMYPGVMQS